ncbi:hypothetical protein [Rubripirellula reticaptiva]|uniref:Uncharacterized protein n=1 Tax=Rubripirellula reticaptiva TaxID=2528013 RepID=A0A5C6EPC0_9BACT|nr:hypothetical protein [Rubripirellula reticaptiva]TWU49481.1 hypothetical protein Poly59_40960 [Rubripirellula reticaptiva]
MEIFEFIATDDSGDCFTLAQDLVSETEDARFIGAMEALESQADKWVPVPVEFDGGEGARELDVYPFDSFVIVNSKALCKFSDVEGVEFLPIKEFTELPSYFPDDFHGFVLHFTRQVSVGADSDLKYFTGTDTIRDVNELVVSSKEIGKSCLFQVKGGGNSIFCTSAFMKHLIEARCSGVLFEGINSRIVE